MMFRAHGRFVESLGGRYITAEDVGTSTADMDYVHMETKNVSGLAGRSRATRRPSRPTAYSARSRRRPRSAGAATTSSDKTVAVQGCGHVGYFLAKELHESGAKLVVTDIDPDAREARRRRIRRAGRGPRRRSMA